MKLCAIIPILIEVFKEKKRAVKNQYAQLISRQLTNDRSELWISHTNKGIGDRR